MEHYTSPSFQNSWNTIQVHLFKIHGILYKSTFLEFMEHYISPFFQNSWNTIQVHLFKIHGILYKSMIFKSMDFYKVLVA